MLVAVYSRKPAISLKRRNIGLRLLLMTNRKLHTRFDDWYQILDGHYGHYALFQSTCVVKAHYKNFNEDRYTLSAAWM